MRRHKFRLTVAVLAFLTGASLDYQLRRPGATPDCFCTGAKCRLVFVADHPLVPLKHPVETFESLRAARRLD